MKTYPHGNIIGNILEFDSNHFGILLLKIVKPRDYNEKNPPISKMFRNYEPVRYYFTLKTLYPFILTLCAVLLISSFKLNPLKLFLNCS